MAILSLPVLGTGVELWLLGRRFGSWWLTAHTATFVLRFAVMTLHVIGHLERAPTLVLRDLTGRPPRPGRSRRRAWLAASLLLGVVLAAASLAPASPLVAPSSTEASTIRKVRRLGSGL